MDAWVLWLIVACAFGAGEMLSGSAFYLAPFAIGAAVAAGADAALGDLVAVVVFVAVSVGTLMVVRPLVTSRLLRGPLIRTGARALVGTQAVVVKDLTGNPPTGQVKIGGEVWTARSLDGDHEIPIGTTVNVVEIEGATALVME